MKKIFLCFLVIYSLFLTACPKETAVRNGAKASYSLSGLTVDAINATGRAWTEKLIDIETKDKMANALKTLSIGGKRFNQALELAVRANGENLPADVVTALNKLFSEEVVVPFLDVLRTAKVLSADRAEYLHVAIAAIRTAVLTISAGFAAANARNNHAAMEVQLV